MDEYKPNPKKLSTTGKEYGFNFQSNPNRQMCPIGNLYCKVSGEKEKHLHCDSCCSPEIFTSKEDLKKHSTIHYL